MKGTTGCLQAFLFAIWLLAALVAAATGRWGLAVPAALITAWVWWAYGPRRGR